MTHHAPTLPAGPLTAAVASAARRSNRTPCGLFGCPEDTHTSLHRCLHGADERVPLELAEDICEEVLGWHARSLYGQAWDHAAETAAEQPDPDRWRRDRDQAQEVHQLARQHGTAAAARQLGISYSALAGVFTHWGWDIPRIRPRPAVLADPTVAAAAAELAGRVGVDQAARVLRTSTPTLRAAWTTWAVPAPAPRRAPTRIGLDPGLAAQALQRAGEIGTAETAQEYGVARRTLYHAWDRFGLGTPQRGQVGVAS